MSERYAPPEGGTDASQEERMRVGDLFSGIGGMSLGLERAGMVTRWFSEIDPYASKVLAKHWSGVPNHGDITKIDGGSVEPVDVLGGGFPCHDISQVATGWDRPGLDGKRSGLWSEYARLVREIRPRYVLIENVASLLYAGRGFDRVLRDLAAIGYDAEWRVFPASSVGAPHQRARLWMVAYPNHEGKPGVRVHAKTPVMPSVCPPVRNWPDPPRGLRMDDGLPSRLDRNRTLGNAVVPQIPELIGGWIIEHAKALDLAA